MQQYITDADYLEMAATEDFASLLAIALSIMKRMPQPLVQQSGPITTGGSGTQEENERRFREATMHLAGQGHTVFDFLVFQDALERIKDVAYGEGYCIEILEIFFRGLFESGYIAKVFFLPDWESSRGSRWEREIVTQRGLEVIDLPVGFFEITRS